MLRIFSHYIPVSIVLLVIIETLVLFFSVYLGVEIRFMDAVDKEASISLIRPLDSKAYIFTFSMLLSMTAMGLHTRNVVDDFSSMMIRIFLSFGLGFFVTAIVYYIYPQFFLGRGVVAITFFVGFVGILLTRTLHQKLDNHNIFKRKVLVLGSGKNGLIVEGVLDKAKKQGYDVIGCIAINDEAPLVNEKNLVEIETTLLDLCLDNKVDEIILAMDDRRNQFPATGLLECKMKGILVNDLTVFLERIKGHLELDAVRPSTIIFSEGFTKAVSMNTVKRVFDVLSSLIILIFASPIIVLTYISIWLSTFGKDPVFYRQVRVGLCDGPFNVLKFRSMRSDAEKNGAQFATKGDSRITKIGSFIRLTRIDELPQLLNVLKGDMSFIGPRPERPEFVLQYEQSIPHYALRHTVKPGITGWAQICHPYSDTEEDTKLKLQYDLYYIKNYSIFLDLTILLQTIQVVLFGQGSR